MKKLFKEITENFASFQEDAAAQVEKGNKAAGTRARKVSLAIEKQLKEFRKQSIAAAK
ncbi:histone H1 [Bacteroidia bacterium]|nr:histone H1 [Bacteroidia bacterium]